ncbi:hypothetical protein B0H10DRAFT_2221244 [Mycena sp. CBHHK59/15]|nr:hypothetical protein B0H10DRAFT_2247026 [Mycena sp. CBHHK59/15]KAJ6547871.1 hypothetical protein B0H10DRAFT_2243341 [Mycena sp. CBHHK59/15]KAJ6556479.1 hypothetical protein B0H10DRAFT_2241227 [Mycena sp. CBHHK59/15]KAJ6608532.1 hypothetical protein B0H10DRAFT_2226704 [Mycena sp. CBHHK59/15]KAJ6614505.1 hypothetical protein B0H10DRAFT_2221244 [Mycena sp. CBHHK59/15]
MSGLSGSSKDNPWCMDANGRLVLQKSRRGRRGIENTAPVPTAPKKIIHLGPPSTITQYTRKRHGVPPPQPPSSARTRIIYRKGRRQQRDEPLKEADLYLDGARPPVGAPTVGHRCVICHCIKSHPVSHQKCGHSYCYVCVRLRLEREWTCPYVDCNRVIRKAPRLDVAEEESIKVDYPYFDDQSRVSFNWDGLTFPRAPKPIEVSSSP